MHWLLQQHTILEKGSTSPVVFLYFVLQSINPLQLVYFDGLLLTLLVHSFLFVGF